MLTAHQKGACVIAVYTRDVAETKAKEATEIGKSQRLSVVLHDGEGRRKGFSVATTPDRLGERSAKASGEGDRFCTVARTSHTGSPLPRLTPSRVRRLFPRERRARHSRSCEGNSDCQKFRQFLNYSRFRPDYSKVEWRSKVPSAQPWNRQRCRNGKEAGCDNGK